MIFVNITFLETNNVKNEISNGILHNKAKWPIWDVTINRLAITEFTLSIKSLYFNEINSVTSKLIKNIKNNFL